MPRTDYSETQNSVYQNPYKVEEALKFLDDTEYKLTDNVDHDLEFFEPMLRLIRNEFSVIKNRIEKNLKSTELDEKVKTKLKDLYDRFSLQFA